MTRLNILSPQIQFQKGGLFSALSSPNLKRNEHVFELFNKTLWGSFVIIFNVMGAFSQSKHKGHENGTLENYVYTKKFHSTIFFAFFLLRV